MSFSLGKFVHESPARPARLVIAATFVLLPLLVWAAQQPFAITISTAHNAFKSGDTISVGVSLKNMSNREIPLSGTCAPKGDTEGYEIEVKDDWEKVPAETNFLRLLRGEPVPASYQPELTWSGPICGAVPPKGFSNTAIIVSMFYDLTKPGNYKIRLRRFDRATKTLVESNTVTVTVTQ